ncbi:heme-binding protein [Bacillus aquiflavi]|uniref:Heme-binding protein n=1 Tax=Bacillus aquiflavi TaxID=2672567 RepID=A0A6B3W2V0_9BACI|nr:heme-binding protein [Bacillus aquiflavi]MBA4538027.1 heme-binding protein [Bacillus aquiflavi]NEY82283.1 heme-binding protein [Bacillus aquiflavi]UAC48807.1 heme-binding protein [Bacillus aquiflavi]
MFLEKLSVSNRLATQMVNEAKKKAEQLGIHVNIAVVDSGGHLLAFERMDHAPILSIEIAQNKAYTAAAFGIPTHEWYPLIEHTPQLKAGIVHTSRLVIFGGGYPIQIGNKLAGAIGVSGGTEEEDQLCCEAALRLIENSVYTSKEG